MTDGDRRQVTGDRMLVFTVNRLSSRTTATAFITGSGHHSEAVRLTQPVWNNLMRGFYNAAVRMV